MALNEDEQRILQQIERSFYDSDPDIAQKLATTTVYSASGRRVKIAVGVFVLGFAFLLALYSQHIVFGLVGFLIMLASAFVFVAELRKMGRAGIADLENSLRQRAVEADRRARLRNRFRREDNN